nr:MAG TPA: hypothetical protein [Caudoviricetes sp.]
MAVSREADGMRGRSYTNHWWAPKYVWEDIDLPSQVDTPGAGSWWCGCSATRTLPGWMLSRSYLVWCGT